MVIFPDHLHCIWTLPPGDADFSTRWHDIKVRFAAQISGRERLSARRLKKGERGIWQRRFWEHVIRDERYYRKGIKEAPMEVIGRAMEKGTYKESHKKLLAYLVIVALMGTVVLLSGFKSKPNSPYVGIWKLEKIVIDGKSIQQNQVVTLKIFPDGNLEIWMDLISITGTYEILDNGRLQISEEFIGKKPIEPPTFSEWTIQGGKLVKSSGRKKTIFKKEEE